MVCPEGREMRFSVVVQTCVFFSDKLLSQLLAWNAAALTSYCSERSKMADAVSCIG